MRRVSELRGACFAAAFVTAIWIVLFLHDPLLFWNDDYELSILPVFADVARSWSEGNLPLLSPYSWVCSNLAGEFQYGTFSVFVNAAVVAIWKLPLSFPQQAAALSLVHLFVLAMGGYLLARGRELAPPLATIVACVAALNGWIVCWGATDWFGALGAFAWFPWAWWAMERAADPTRGRWRYLGPAPFVYLLVTGGFPYTVVMFALLSVWLAAKTITKTRRVTSVFPMIVGAILGFGLSSPAWLALFDYLRGSARQGGDAASHFQWIVPAAALPGLILPAWTVRWADFSSRLVPHISTELACGLVPAVALLVGIAAGRRSYFRRVGWELGLLGCVLVIAMLPSANVFRWSFRWLPFLHLTLALCGAEALSTFARETRGTTSAVLRRALLSLPTLGSVALASLAMWLLHAQGPVGFSLAIFLGALAAAWVGLELFLPERTFSRWVPVGVTSLAFLATYWVIPPNSGVPKYHLAPDLTNAKPLDADRLYLSVYPPAEFTYTVDRKPLPIGQLVRPGSTSMWAGLRFLNGYSPIRPSGVARNYRAEIHGDFSLGEMTRLLTDEAGSRGELALLGVDGIVVASEVNLRPKPAEDWETVFSADEATVYHRRAKLAPVRAVPDANMLGQRARLNTPTVLSDSRNSVVAKIQNASALPQTVVFSRPYFPGYRATYGYQNLEVANYGGLVPSVTIPAGTKGTLTLVYRPWWLTIGGAIASLTLVVWIGSALLAARSGKA